MNWQNILRSLPIHIMHWQKEQITIINIDYTIVSIIEYCAEKLKKRGYITGVTVKGNYLEGYVRKK